MPSLRGSNHLCDIIAIAWVHALLAMAVGSSGEAGLLRFHLFHHVAAREHPPHVRAWPNRTYRHNLRCGFLGQATVRCNASR